MGVGFCEEVLDLRGFVEVCGVVWCVVCVTSFLLWNIADENKNHQECFRTIKVFGVKVNHFQIISNIFPAGRILPLRQKSATKCRLSVYPKVVHFR